MIERFIWLKEPEKQKSLVSLYLREQLKSKESKAKLRARTVLQLLWYF